jgi:hypothetical protein
VYAVNGTGSVSVAVTDSVAANGDSFNGNTGFDVESAKNHSVSNLSLTHSLAVGNAIGVAAGSSNATLWLAQSTVTGNGIGYSASNGGVIKSYGDNYLAAGNGSNTGTLTASAGSRRRRHAPSRRKRGARIINLGASAIPVDILGTRRCRRGRTQCSDLI